MGILYHWATREAWNGPLLNHESVLQLHHLVQITSLFSSSLSASLQSIAWICQGSTGKQERRKRLSVYWLCSKLHIFCTFFFSFCPYSDPLQWIMLISYYRHGNWTQKCLVNLFAVTQRRLYIWLQVCHLVVVTCCFVIHFVRCLDLYLTHGSC